LNLAVTNAAGKTPTVSGAVHFRDSFYLKDLQDLAPGKVASPARRPPYFSVEKEPWASWRLNVTADGDQFLRVRSPLFRGKASILLRLEGTLKDPIALGEARINSGSVRFPFGNLEVKQGFATLTSDDPFCPKLFVTAEAQRFGYDVKMQATGPADEPRVEFSSTPPLTSEQIVLMLTTGQMPRGTAMTTTGQQRAQTVALFVGKNLLTELGFGNEDEERLTIRSGEQITETGRPTYEAEYKLAEKWSVIGEYDRFNQLNASLKWKVYSR
jgi:translocation and assembly module TamB